MRIFKFVAGGLFGLLVISVVLKALFFVAFAALLIGGAAMARRAFLRMNGYASHHAMRQHFMHHKWQQYQTIESIDDLVKRQNYHPAFNRPMSQSGSTYREVELI